MKRIVQLHPNQTSDERRRAMKGTYRGPPYADGRTIRLASPLESFEVVFVNKGAGVEMTLAGIRAQDAKDAELRAKAFLSSPRAWTVVRCDRAE